MTFKLIDLPFIVNNIYLQQYLELVSKSVEINLGYTEMHHIICKAFFKFLKVPIDNSSTNLVRLLFKDHCKAHWLLYKCTTGIMQEAMANAFISMVNFKNDKTLLELGLSETEYEELQNKIEEIRGNSTTRFWSLDEINFLKINYAEKGLRFCAEKLGRSITAVKSKVADLGLKIARYYSEAELNFLKENYIKYGCTYCAKQLKRTIGSIRTKASELNLTTDYAYTEAEKNFLLQNYKIKGPEWCAKQLHKPYEVIRAYAAHSLHIKTLPQDTPIYCPELDKTFSSIKAASVELQMSDGGICQVVNGKQKAIHGLTFIKIDKVNFYEKGTC